MHVRAVHRAAGIAVARREAQRAAVGVDRDIGADGLGTLVSDPGRKEHQQVLGQDLVILSAAGCDGIDHGLRDLRPFGHLLGRQRHDELESGTAGGGAGAFKGELIQTSVPGIQGNGHAIGVQQVFIACRQEEAEDAVGRLAADHREIAGHPVDGGLLDILVQKHIQRQIQHLALTERSLRQTEDAAVFHADHAVRDVKRDAVLLDTADHVAVFTDAVDGGGKLHIPLLGLDADMGEHIHLLPREILEDTVSRKRGADV